MKILDITKGFSGIVAVEASTLIPTPDTMMEVAKLIIQAIIAIATIWTLIKKKKP